MGLLDKVTEFFNRGDESPAVRLGRNDRCWCGSGKKYKHCHLREDEKKQKGYVSCGKS